MHLYYLAKDNQKVDGPMTLAELDEKYPDTPEGHRLVRFLSEEAADKWFGIEPISEDDGLPKKLDEALGLGEPEKPEERCANCQAKGVPGKPCRLCGEIVPDSPEVEGY